MKLNMTSLSRLRGVHPDLVRVVLRCADDWKDKDTGFIVTQGVRTLQEQNLLVKKGGLEMAESVHVRFLYNEKTFRFMFPINGAPTWKSALTPANGSNTLSPFVSLATRA